MTGLSDELEELCGKAGFTRSDMAHWCETSNSAMREWMKRDVTPHPIKMKYLQERMDLLRGALKNDPRLPIPAGTNFGLDRYQYVEKVRDHALGRISKGRASKRGDILLDKHPQ